jgi:hypothetical protein
LHACTPYPYEHLRETEPVHHLEIDEVATDMIPVLPPCEFLKMIKTFILLKNSYYSPITYLAYLKLTAYFLPPRKTWKIVDETYYTAGTTLTWQEKRYLVSFVDDIESLKGTYGAGRNDARYLPLVHTLNHTNIRGKILKVHLIPGWFW